jgi:hypothetical protein
MREGYCDYIPYGNDEIQVGHNPEMRVLLIHQSVWGSNATMPPGCDGITMKDLLKKYPDYDLIVAGDTHTPLFYGDKDGRKVLVPGCVTKQAADFKDIELFIYEYNKEGSVTSIPLPVVDKIVNDKYLVEEHERDQRLEAFVESLKKTGGVTLDFKENVYKQMKKSGIKKQTEDIIRGLMEVNGGEE